MTMKYLVGLQNKFDNFMVKYMAKNKTIKEDGWTSKLVVHDACPHAKNVTLFMNERDLNKILKLEQEFDTVEFSIYFNVKPYTVDDIEGHIISELIIPNQIVSSVTIDYTDNLHTDGVLHKHPSGCNSFSGVDDEFINANHDYSLLLVDKEFKEGISRIKTPCGCLLSSGINMQILLEENKELDDFIEEAKEKIKKYVHKVTTTISKHFSGWTPNVVCAECGKFIKKKQYTECSCGIPYCKSCKDKLNGCPYCLDGMTDAYTDKYKDNVDNDYTF